MVHIFVPQGASPEAYRKFLRALQKRLVYDEKTSTVRVKKGMLIDCIKYGPFTENDFDFALGQYEPEVAAALCKYCRPGMTVFDIGANAGYITMLLANLVGNSGQVHAFEPIPENVQFLMETLNMNKITNVTVHQFAVADCEGEAQMVYDGVFDGYSTLLRGGHGYYTGRAANTILVKTITLDQFCRDACISRIDLVKMDIEGAEMLALEGMSQVLSSSYRPILIVEFWGIHNVSEGQELLNRLGYDIKILSAWHGIVSRNKVDIQTVLGIPIEWDRV